MVGMVVFAVVATVLALVVGALALVGYLAPDPVRKLHTTLATESYPTMVRSTAPHTVVLSPKTVQYRK
jgi:hypothetical protein